MSRYEDFDSPIYDDDDRAYDLAKDRGELKPPPKMICPNCGGTRIKTEIKTADRIAFYNCQNCDYSSSERNDFSGVIFNKKMRDAAIWYQGRAFDLEQNRWNDGIEE